MPNRRRSYEQSEPMRIARPSSRPQAPRSYEQSDLDYFATFREARALYRPLHCNQRHRQCWVELGPPGITGTGKCRGCRQSPLLSPAMVSLHTMIDLQRR